MFLLGIVGASAGDRRDGTCADPPPALPRLEAIAVAPTEIRLSVELADNSTTMSATGGPEGEPPRSLYVAPRSEAHGRRRVTHGEAIVSARPDTTYRFRASAEVYRDGVRETRESDDSVVRTPPEPAEAPMPPSDVTVAARSPFTLEVRWRPADALAYGFEIERRDDTGEFRHVALGEPDARSLVDHGHRPARASSYRVRAFNPRGTSDWSVTVSGVTRRLAELRPPPRKEPPATCTTLDAETARIAAEWAFPEVPPTTTVCRDIALDGEHRVDALNVPLDCGAQNCGWTLYGDVDGCYRELGSFTVDTRDCPRFETVAVGADAWPVLRAYAHESARASRVAVHVFLHGRYVDVDDYVACGMTFPVVRTANDVKVDDDPTHWTPPFAGFFAGCW